MLFREKTICTENFYKALTFAIKAHDVQHDEAGEPYILHPIAVSSLLKTEEIPYLLCYPENTNEAKEEYLRRYTERGNNEYFIDIFIGCWDSFLRSHECDTYGKHVVMRLNEYLSDVIKTVSW